PLEVAGLPEFGDRVGSGQPVRPGVRPSHLVSVDLRGHRRHHLDDEERVASDLDRVSGGVFDLRRLCRLVRDPVARSLSPWLQVEPHAPRAIHGRDRNVREIHGLLGDLARRAHLRRPRCAGEPAVDTRRGRRHRRRRRGLGRPRLLVARLAAAAAGKGKREDDECGGSLHDVELTFARGGAPPPRGGARRPPTPPLPPPPPSPPPRSSEATSTPFPRPRCPPTTRTELAGTSSTDASKPTSASFARPRSG